MFNKAELELLKQAPPQFPIIAAASAAYRRCGKCGHKNVNVCAMLHTAALLYRRDGKLATWLNNQGISTPCDIAGVTVGEANG